MWTLRPHSTDTVGDFVITPSTEPLKVGRHEDCQLHIASDQSVSRVHCLLRVDSQSVLILRDCRSKFGTFVNGIQVRPEEDQVLRTGDRVKFGAVNSEYTVVMVESNVQYTKRQIVELVLGGKPIPIESSFKPRQIDRISLFCGLSFKNIQNCEDFIQNCGGRIDNENGLEWTEEDIYDAIIYGKLRSKPSSSLTVVADFTLPPQPTKMITAKNTTILNVKRFRKVQPLSLPDIIGLADMAVHGRTTRVVDENVDNPPLPVHPEYQPKRPIEQYFDPPQAQKRVKQQAIAPQDFQTDFFKSLL